MLAGRFRLSAPDARDEGTLGFALGFGETELRYLDEMSMGKAYLLAAGRYRGVPGLEKVGVDVLSPEFTRERFEKALRARRDQVRVFLLDKSALDSLGNAYADEVLFEAGLHPKTWARSLPDEDVTRLHAAIVSVLTAARDEIARRAPPIDTKLRDFLKVRLKETCPRCGAKIRRAAVRAMDASFCPRCQPERRPGFIDWKKTL
jgi:formamidopyrimidine-DNA glycosylase